jgi:hypothetical protein
MNQALGSRLQRNVRRRVWQLAGQASDVENYITHSFERAPDRVEGMRVAGHLKN